MKGKMPFAPRAGCHDCYLKINKEYSRVQEPGDLPVKQVSGNILRDIRKGCGPLSSRWIDLFFCSEGNRTD